MNLRERRGVSGAAVAIIAVVAVIVIVALAFASVRIVNPGERGVLVQYGKVSTCGNNGTLCEPLGEGIHMVTPIQDSVVVLPVKTVRYDIANVTVHSKDSNKVTLNLAVNYHLNPDKVPYIFQHVGDEKAVESIIVDPAANVGLREGVRNFDAVDLNSQLPAVEASVIQMLDERFAPYDIQLDGIALTGIHFEKTFDDSINAKISAQNDLQRIMTEAQSKIVAAEGDRNATIQQAQGQAIAIKSIEQACKCDYIQYQAIQKWNGILPQVNSGGNIPFILNLPQNKTG